MPFTRRDASTDYVPTNTPTTTTCPPELSKRPPELFVLWKKYEFGTGGNKPAKLFTAKERGAVKCTLSLRLTFWNAVDSMIRRGHTSDTAIDAVCAVYGRGKSATSILRAMRDDKARGGHPNLSYL
ncbi:hypothetical protein H310_10873 [Aphanomyces invadans]|uniref:Uncharacterized protein n=1 Tax=Aphanomyces invadans TaxID=157072 RepID=A0A024TP94_9STRA|nr:hypothetical protein H310_10873 [Aphanomyces invadans]ETV95829.1 hypothetical protein H310_10873 [Aphanomyces invadans]|eukprot:XP_008875580.1 hypothetical protein H310_10873 [Aphanomyces invadans]